MSEPGPSTSREAAEVPAEAAATARGSKRARASSTSSSSSSASSDSSSSSSGARRRRRHKRKKRHHGRKLKQLISEVSGLKRQLTSRNSFPELDSLNNEDVDIIDPNVSGELFEADSDKELGFSLPFATKTKEPAIPTTSPEMLEQLKLLQRFDQEQWSDVRYSDIQKLYVHKPGFTNLDPNEEVRQYDTSKTLINTEKAFAGITYGLLKQRDALQSEMRDFLVWARQADQLSYENIYTKLNDIFTTGEYVKATNDTCQLVCGHRAELIQHRREAILASVKDPYYKNALRKIPPTCTTLFDTEKFSAVLEKAGGIKSVFWTKQKDRSTSAPQADPGTSSTQDFSTRKPVKPNYKQVDHGRSKQSNGNFRGRGGKVSGFRGRGTAHRGSRKRSPTSHRDSRAQHKRKY